MNSIFLAPLLYYKVYDLLTFWLFKMHYKNNYASKYGLSSFNIILIANFLLFTYFKTLYFLKLCPIFNNSTLCLFTKYNIFLGVSWFLAKNLSNFVSLPWKLDNPYCHKLYIASIFRKSIKKISDTEFVENCVITIWRLRLSWYYYGGHMADRCIST